MPQRIAS